MNICFVDNTDFKYDGDSIYSHKLRGAESVVINLSKALKVLGHKVTVINNCVENKQIDGVSWIDIKSIKKTDEFDFVIANGDCRLFKYAKSNKNILFSHSLQSIEKFLRKKQLISYMKYKPKVCFISNYHQKNRSKLLYIFGHIHLRWSVDELFLRSNLSSEIDNNLAIFTSRPDRNLELLINIWTNSIIKMRGNSKLLVTDNNFIYKNSSISKRKLGNQKDLLRDLLKARICLLPGHKSELFCLAAEEARELCIPIITLGLGCLGERVEHNTTGFIAKNEHEFANYTLKLFSDDELWNRLRLNLIKKRKTNTWKKVAEQLIDQLY